MRHATIRARAQAQAKLLASPQNSQSMLWSIGVLLSAAMLYLAWLS